MKVPQSISFERQPSLDFTDDTTEQNTTSSSLSSSDELQALNTALCFLASINADYTVVDAFLRAHPQALILEGVGPIPEESACFLLEYHRERCACTTNPDCRDNRTKLLGILHDVAAFEHYEWERWCNPGESLPTVCLEPLTQYEANIRNWRHEELLLRNKLLEAAALVRQSKRRKRGLRLWCKLTQTNKQKATAALHFSTVQGEHDQVVEQIRQARHDQFRILQQAFRGCRRHVCRAAGAE